MAEWKPIETLELHTVQCNSPYMRSSDVMLWVKSEYGYSGAVIGFISIYRIPNGTPSKTVNVSGVGGYDCEEDFKVEDVTHWTEIPKGPGE